MPNNINVTITITGCASCPFFERNVANVLVDIATKRSTKTGACKHDGAGMGYPFGRFAIDDMAAPPPERCPLRKGGTLVQLAGGS